MENRPNLAVISDIDGTVSDRRHRLKFLEDKKDWKSFFAHLSEDPPIQSTIDELARHYNQGTRIIFVTGRPEDYKEKTLDWLNKHLPFNEFDLIMRPSKNYEKDISIKRKILLTILKTFEVVKVYEDQTELINMWEENGLECVNCSLD